MSARLSADDLLLTGARLVKALTELQAADAYCRYLAGRHYENFSVASLIVPSALRLHLARIYAFCRTTDDLGDESGPSALPRLALWREQVHQCFDGGPDPVHPVLLALRRTVAAFDLSPRPFLDLIEANVQDQLVSTYDTWDELRQYCLLSAAPVGRLVQRVFGVRDPHAGTLADDVCIGLQLANFAQDVAVDRAKGRIYLPQSDLRAHGLHGAVRVTCERAESLLTCGRELEDMVPSRLRVQLALYRLGGTAILAAIRRMGYRTDHERPRVSPTVKAGLVPRAFIQSRRRRGYVRTQQAV
jgi:squalene synthase HpnC